MVACSMSGVEDDRVLQGRGQGGGVLQGWGRGRWHVLGLGSRIIECSRMVGSGVRGDWGAMTVADGSVSKIC
jgi:hypothetical protein